MAIESVRCWINKPIRLLVKNQNFESPGCNLLVVVRVLFGKESG